MTRTDRRRMARDLSGPAASVLFALLLANGPVTATDLAKDWCGLSRLYVQKGLDRLADYGLVIHHGKRVGYAVNLQQLALWQGHSGVYLEKATSDLPGSVASRLKATIYQEGSVAPSSPEHEVIHSQRQIVNNSPPESENCANFTIPSRSDQIRSISGSEDFESDQSDLLTIVKNLQIDGTGRGKLIAAQADAATLYGWYLWALEQSWVQSAKGWAIRCTLAGDLPQPNYLEQARQYLANGGTVAAPAATHCAQCSRKLTHGECLYCAGVINS